MKGSLAGSHKELKRLSHPHGENIQTSITAFLTSSEAARGNNTRRQIYGNRSSKEKEAWLIRSVFVPTSRHTNLLYSTLARSQFLVRTPHLESIS